MKGHAGKILRANLTTKSVKTIETASMKAG